jgi:hypothetical protein
MQEIDRVVGSHNTVEERVEFSRQAFGAAVQGQLLPS